MTSDRFIYHLVGARDYQLLPPGQPYAPDSLRLEGFIHCTAEKSLLLDIANAFFADAGDSLLVLTINPKRLTAPLKYERPVHPSQTSGATVAFVPPPQMLFPHIFGPLNRNAVLDVFALERRSDGRWHWPSTKE